MKVVNGNIEFYTVANDMFIWLNILIHTVDINL